MGKYSKLDMVKTMTTPQDGFIHIAASGWISVNTEEKKKQTLYTKS